MADNGARATTEEFPSFLTQKNSYPYDYYEEARELFPEGVRWDEEMGAWLVMKYGDCRAVHREEDRFAHRYLDFKGAVEVHGGKRGILNIEGPGHTTLHRFLISFFSVRKVGEYRDLYVKPLIDRLLDKVEGADSVNLDQALADPLPAYVICALLGVPLEDEKTLANCKNWNEIIMKWSGTFGEDPVILEEARGAAQNLKEVLMPVIEARRENRGDDLVSALWNQGPELLEGWTEEDMLAQARVMLFAGAESTSHLLRNCIYLLATRPDLRDQVQADRELIPKFVEETLRYLGVIHFHVRAAEEDAELGGCPVHKGDRIHTLLVSANRDPEKFEDPLDFKMDRKNAREHLGFGFGPRLCIGANLARAEAAEVVEAVLDRYPKITLDETGEQPTMSGHMPKSFSPLPARLRG